MIVNFIVPFYKNRDTIKKLLLSLEDQDYKKFDCTIVIDGPDAEADLQICGYLDSKEFSFPIYIERLRENMGAAAARNFGAKISGENRRGCASHEFPQPRGRPDASGGQGKSCT